MAQKVYEVNFDGLIGPTHNFSGLAYGNIPSQSNRNRISYPKKAALEGLQKMKLLHSLGLKQGLVPPQIRPDINAIKKRGHKGSDKEILEKVGNGDFELLLQCSSASSMWAANAACVSTSFDTRDGKVHITPANLRTHPHRSLEVQQTYRLLKHIFKSDGCIVHEPLKDLGAMFDEGAANHMRLAESHGQEGINIFVYGKSAGETDGKYPARQTREASQHIAYNHQLKEKNTLFVQQNPKAIDRGVFHNDVIAMSNENVLIYHEMAFLNTKDVIKTATHKFKNVCLKDLCCIEISDKQLSVKEAVDSYFFNSQLVTKPNGDMVMIAPFESKEGRARICLDAIVKQDNPVKEMQFVKLYQSMANGGGPACLRLRVVLTEAQIEDLPGGYLLKDETFGILEKWINDYYRDEFHNEQLKDYRIFEESRKALAQLVKILDLGPIYSF